MVWLTLAGRALFEGRKHTWDLENNDEELWSEALCESADSSWMQWNGSHLSSQSRIFIVSLICVQIQAQPQTVTLTQAATSAPAQVQMIPAGTATAQVVQQKIIPQQVVTAAASPQIQTPPPHSPAQQPAAPSAAESPVQQPTQPQQSKSQARQGGVRAKTPAKPSGGSS